MPFLFALAPWTLSRVLPSFQQHLISTGVRDAAAGYLARTDPTVGAAQTAAAKPRLYRIRRRRGRAQGDGI